MTRRFLLAWLLNLVVVGRLRPPHQSSWRGILTTTPARSSSATSATSGSPNEDGTGAHRISDHTARDIYPRFSPDGKWIAFSSNRYGNNDVFVIPAGGRRREAADVPQRQR